MRNDWKRTEENFGDNCALYLLESAGYTGVYMSKLIILNLQIGHFSIYTYILLKMIKMFPNLDVIYIDT